MRLLEEIRSPADLAGLSRAGLVALAAEIRAFLIDTVSATGGHLGPNLGVVEMTIAIHRVFTSPRDVLLFDTGHQAYVHKILTGRCAEFESLRHADGLSGYPCRAESVHDVIENSHASTALSYADGLAKAFALQGATQRRIVVIVGDGALTGGMCWEALNNLGAAPHRPVIIVLNDNGRSYCPTVGGLARHLAQLRRGELTHPTLFEDLGLAYLGPVDGHDITAIENALRHAEALHRPVVVHCLTRKGKGYPPAEQDETDHLHTVGVINPDTGRPYSTGSPTWTSVFAQEITAIGAEHPEVVCLTAAMLHPTGLGEFAARFPERVFDVGIAEQHALTCAAGLALGGCHPVVALYSTFASRAFDQLLMDVALHRLPLTLVLDRAGITGPDGPSHHGMWDASLLPLVPGLRLAAPRDATQLRELLREALTITDGPDALFFLATTRVLTETLRLYPPGWMLTRVLTTEATLADRTLPAGTTLVYSPYLIQRRPDFYPNPDHFDPDRWLPDRAATLPRGAFIPFGSGARKCIGDTFALLEATLALATITARWQLDPLPHTITRPPSWRPAAAPATHATTPPPPINGRPPMEFETLVGVATNMCNRAIDAGQRSVGSRLRALIRSSAVGRRISTELHR